MTGVPSCAACPDGPLPAYRALVSAGSLDTDPAQAAAAARLQDLWSKLRGYDPKAGQGGHALFARLLPRKRVDESPAAVNGLYLVGDVGRGKSMLMDLFFKCADVPRKRRSHFHRFMQDAHAAIHAWRVGSADGADPIPPLADRIAAGAALLCFDEFQVNDIADAMLLGRLFKALFARGVVVVATSNTPPDALFAGRPGRDAFLPFIGLLQRHLDVLVLDGGRDHRRQRLRGQDLWLVPDDAAATAALDAAFAGLAGGDVPAPATLHVTGRVLTVPVAARGVARFAFDALCAAALGPGDYLALAVHFPALVLDHVPVLSADNHNEARRFIVLIDALYDHRVRLAASAAAQPDLLYPEGHGAAAFRRTASRLEEMRSLDYLSLPHLT